MQNDGRQVNPEKFSQTHEELIARFGGLTVTPHSVSGMWVHEGTRYEDQLHRLCVDVDDTEEAEEFFLEWKAILLERFEQIEIYMIWYSIERV